MWPETVSECGGPKARDSRSTPLFEDCGAGVFESAVEPAHSERLIQTGTSLAIV